MWRLLQLWFVQNDKTNEAQHLKAQLKVFIEGFWPIWGCNCMYKIYQYGKLVFTSLFIFQGIIEILKIDLLDLTQYIKTFNYCE